MDAGHGEALLLKSLVLTLTVLQVDTKLGSYAGNTGNNDV